MEIDNDGIFIKRKLIKDENDTSMANYKNKKMLVKPNTCSSIVPHFYKYFDSINVERYTIGSNSERLNIVISEAKAWMMEFIEKIQSSMISSYSLSFSSSFLNQVKSWYVTHQNDKNIRIELSKTKFRVRSKLNPDAIRLELNSCVIKQPTVKQLAKKYSVSISTMNRFIRKQLKMSFKTCRFKNDRMIGVTNARQVLVFLHQYLYLMKTGACILYGDESSFNNQIKQSKKWSNINQECLIFNKGKFASVSLTLTVSSSGFKFYTLNEI